MKYDPQKFISIIKDKTGGKRLVCPFCNGSQFTTTEDFATVLIGKELSCISIGLSIPSGMIICQKCGHIDFFALGALDLLNNREEDNDNGKQ